MKWHEKVPGGLIITSAGFITCFGDYNFHNKLVYSVTDSKQRNIFFFPSTTSFYSFNCPTRLLQPGTSIPKRLDSFNHIVLSTY